MFKNYSAKSVKSNRINITGLVMAELLSDTSDGTVYGEVEELADVMQVQLTPSLSTGVLYGEGRQTENIAKINALACVVDVNKVAIEKRAKLLGHEYVDGVLKVAAGDEPKYYAIGYKVEGTNNTCELVWLLKGRAQPYNSSVQQSTENINFSTDSITINFIPRDSDKVLYYFADTANPDFTKDQESKWFLSGPSTYPIPPKEEIS